MHGRHKARRKVGKRRRELGGDIYDIHKMSGNQGHFTLEP